MSLTSIHATLALLLASVLAVSAVAKATELSDARRTMDALRIRTSRPRLVVGSVALTEAALSGALLTTAGTHAVWAAGGALGLTGAFVVVAVRAHRAGSTETCGCFGSLSSTTVGPRLSARAITLLTASLMLAVTAAFDVEAVRSPLATAFRPSGQADPLWSTIITAVFVLAFTQVGVPPATSSEAPQPRAGVSRRALISASGEAVVPRQRALQGAPQLLVFLKPGCASCSDALALADQVTMTNFETRCIVAIGDAEAVDPAAHIKPRHPESTTLHSDVDGALAEAFGLPASRPFAVIVKTDGEIDEAVYDGAEAVLGLLSALTSDVGGLPPSPPAR